MRFTFAESMCDPAQLLPLAIEVKQALLEMRDAGARLGRLAAALEPPEGGSRAGS